MKEDRFPSAEMELPVLLETHTKSFFFLLSLGTMRSAEGGTPLFFREDISPTLEMF